MSGQVRVGEWKKGRVGDHLFFPSSPRPNYRSKKGFTLVELLVVLAIVAAMIAISIPAVSAFTSPKEMLRKEGRRVMILMNEARREAMSRKIRVDVRIDPVRNEIRAVESHAYRTLMANYPDGLINREDSKWLAVMSNRFERILVFSEEWVLEGFSIEEIKAPFDETEMFPFMEGPEQDFQSLKHPEAETIALSFTHFGGSDGGGVSLYFKERRLDIAADILTGRPRVVNRRMGEGEKGGTAQ
ncbi:MAG: prepilin-type N-terminal cleavage/methylation domain-containing protein [Pontiella sp.]